MPGLSDFTILACVLCFVFGCTDNQSQSIRKIAQPDGPATRNYTSFSEALQCLDELMLMADKPRTILTATRIPDNTRQISVGARDMLVNTISRVNRQSKAYLFVEQSILKRTVGDLYSIESDEIINSFDLIDPDFYISGSISQIDNNAIAREGNLEYENSSGQNHRIREVSGSGGSSGSVVTVDLHLIEFPSRIVVPGGSVSNSMVVKKVRFGGGFVGEIFDEALGISFGFEKLESTGQAVRSLIELGVIELLGNHSGVNYWECLTNDPVTFASSNDKIRSYSTTQEVNVRGEVTSALMALGLIEPPIPPVWSNVQIIALARFQAENGLLPTGRPDHETMERLRKASSSVIADAEMEDSSIESRVPGTPYSNEDSYESIQDFITNSRLQQ